MKKVLYSTTALAAAGMFAFSGADAQAAEKVKLGLSGSFTALVGVINNDADKYDNLNSVNIVGDSEIRFSGSTTLDNGIRVDVILELETDHNQRQQAPSPSRQDRNWPRRTTDESTATRRMT